MAELNISQLIQESLMQEADGEGKQESGNTGGGEKKSGLMSRITGGLKSAGNAISSGASAAGNHIKGHKLGYGLGAGGAAAATTLGVLGYKNRDKVSKFVKNHNPLNKSLASRATKFGKKHGGKVAAGTAAALGAAVGTKALLRYLRKKRAGK